MKYKIGIAALAILALGAVVVASGSGPETAEPEATVKTVGTPVPPYELAGGADSIEELVDAFLKALEGTDGAALKKLRISEREYIEFILPGSEPGERAGTRVREDAAEAFWKLNDTRSRYFLATILDQFGGRKLTRKSVRFEEGVREYSWYTTHKATRILVTDENGEEREIHTGSIVDNHGRYKFISYYSDD